MKPSAPELHYSPISLPEERAPQLFVVVDTEEEFDWSAPFSRTNTTVRAIQYVGRLQQVLLKYNLKPTYVVDFPIASQPEGFGPLKELSDSGLARIGAHLHPWVNPPFEEELSARNSYGFSLGPRLETQKIRVLRDQIGQSFDLTPTVYKAGRYGFGTTTIGALESLSFTIDVSINPRMDFSSDGGPSFEAFDTRPFFFGRQRLLEIPCSTDYTGCAGPFAPRLHRVLSHPALKRARLLGVSSRLHLVNKVMLSPEGSTLAEMKELTRTLLRRGIRTFSMTLHSPSLEPGCTPYVRTNRDLEAFISRIDAFCGFFFGDLEGCPSTPDEFRRSLDDSVAGSDRLTAQRPGGA